MLLMSLEWFLVVFIFCNKSTSNLNFDCHLSLVEASEESWVKGPKELHVDSKSTLLKTFW